MSHIDIVATTSHIDNIVASWVSTDSDSDTTDIPLQHNNQRLGIGATVSDKYKDCDNDSVEQLRNNIFGRKKRKTDNTNVESIVQPIDDIEDSKSTVVATKPKIQSYSDLLNHVIQPNNDKKKHKKHKKAKKSQSDAQHTDTVTPPIDTTTIQNNDTNNNTNVTVTAKSDKVSTDGTTPHQSTTLSNASTIDTHTIDSANTPVTNTNETISNNKHTQNKQIPNKHKPHPQRIFMHEKLIMDRDDKPTIRPPIDTVKSHKSVVQKLDINGKRIRQPKRRSKQKNLRKDTRPEHLKPNNKVVTDTA